MKSNKRIHKLFCFLLNVKINVEPWIIFISMVELVFYCTRKFMKISADSVLCVIKQFVSGFYNELFLSLSMIQG